MMHNMNSNNCLILIVVATARMLSTVYAETEDTIAAHTYIQSRAMQCIVCNVYMHMQQCR
jgi:hypothetical protein